jgi:natural product precursor
MKLKKIKLQLNKETIEVLNEMQLNQIHGGTGATIVQTAKESSWRCAVDAYTYATAVDGWGKDNSYWGCPYQEYAKSEYVPFNQKPNGQLDNTNVNTPNGAFICIKPY